MVSCENISQFSLMTLSTSEIRYYLISHYHIW